MQVVVEETKAEDVQRQSRSVAEVHEPRSAFAMHELAQSMRGVSCGVVGGVLERLTRVGA